MTPDQFPGLFNYWVAIVLMMIGFYVVIARGNLVKKIVGLNIFQTSVFVLYITMGKVDGGTAPILAEGIETFSNPLPHVLILTAIVVGVATTALGLAIVVRIRESFGTVEDDEIQAELIRQSDAEYAVTDEAIGVSGPLRRWRQRHHPTPTPDKSEDTS